MEQLRQQLNREFISPLLVDYVKWVLNGAQQRGIHTLYFMARDAYLLREIAEYLCKKYDLNIDCRYFYCSRASLRMPSYCVIGDEAITLLQQSGSKATPRHLLARVQMTEMEQQKVWTDCGWIGDPDAVLDRQGLNIYCSMLANSDVYREIVVKKSKTEYKTTIAYFRQEGMLDSQIVSVVDSGWSGSIQRSLRQLLMSAGFNGKIIGFYFGMYTKPVEDVDGTYLTYFFDADHGKRNKILFNNNLFECLLSAPHGMTVGYVRKENQIVARMKNPVGDVEAIVRMISLTLKNVSRAEAKYNTFTWDKKTAQQRTAQIIKRYMAYPTQEEAQLLGEYLFCDDVTEGYYERLAEASQVERLQEYLLWPRIQRKLLRQEKKPVPTGVYWPYGVMAFLPTYKRCWYRLNFYAWEWLRYTLKRETKAAVHSIAQEIFQKLSPYDTVSFDVFDTLLRRNVQHPTDVFFLMEKQVEVEQGITQFAQLRVNAEAAARAAIDSEEITLDEIYAMVAKLAGIDAETASAIRALELKKEEELLFADPVMIEVFKRCENADKRILVISDMYLNREQLLGLLKMCGYDPNRIYVSSEYRKTKGSGMLYRLVQEKECLDVMSWIHVGDNVVSDYDVPKAMGIAAYRYDNGIRPKAHRVGWIRRLKQIVKVILPKTVNGKS